MANALSASDAPSPKPPNASSIICCLLSLFCSAKAKSIVPCVAGIDASLAPSKLKIPLSATAACRPCNLSTPLIPKSKAESVNFCNPVLAGAKSPVGDFKLCK